MDILFVVDNSSSMGSHQASIAAAFPGFVAAMFESLEPGTNLHVGVTTTEFGYESTGTSSKAADGTCWVEPRGSLGGIYVTPDQVDLGTDGAQGRLRTVDGRNYYDIDTDAPQADRDAFTDWFGRAILAGEDGSNIEMSSGAAAWVGDPVNLPSNAGFLRDVGAVYVIIFIQDEFDQTPADGGDLLAKIAAQKAGCGGMQCVVGGGWYDDACTDMEGVHNLPKMVEQFSNSFVRDLGGPFGGGDIDGTDLSMVLAPIIAEKCAEIPPVG